LSDFHVESGKMKLLVIGFGGCGGRLADEFARLNKRARRQRGVEIVTGAFAVNTDAGDLSRLTSIGNDYQHRILIGGRKTGGYSVGRIRELGAQIVKEEAHKVVGAIESVRHFHDTNAFLLIGSSGGGTGSGALSIMSMHLKERYTRMPVYNLVVLPFEREDIVEARSVYNSAACLKSLSSVSDAVILIDNQRYVRKDFSLHNNLSQINTLIVEPFFDLLCGIEDKGVRWVGTKVLAAEDIINTLLGWTAIGYSKLEMPRFDFLSVWRNLRRKTIQPLEWINAMDEAMNELSFMFNPAFSGRALSLLVAPARELCEDVVTELGEYMSGLAPQAIIRNGGYLKDKGSPGVTLIFSELGEVEKVNNYYRRSTELLRDIGERRWEVKDRLRVLEDLSREMLTPHVQDFRYSPHVGRITTQTIPALARKLQVVIEDSRGSAKRYISYADNLCETGQSQKADEFYEKAVEMQPSLSFEGILPRKRLHRAEASLNELYTYLQSTAR